MAPGGRTIAFDEYGAIIDGLHGRSPSGSITFFEIVGGLVDNHTVKLWIIRHAKSSWADRGQADFERPLNDRGERDGRSMKSWLGRQDGFADWIWSSDAKRALATSEFVRRAFASTNPQIVEDHRLYLADPDAILSVVRETPEDVRSVVLVAHNPGLTYLVNMLAAANATDNLPTFGVARFSYAGKWIDLERGRSKLDFLVSPKTIDR